MADLRWVKIGGQVIHIGGMTTIGEEWWAQDMVNGLTCTVDTESDHTEDTMMITLMNITMIIGILTIEDMGVMIGGGTIEKIMHIKEKEIQMHQKKTTVGGTE